MPLCRTASVPANAQLLHSSRQWSATAATAVASGPALRRAVWAGYSALLGGLLLALPASAQTAAIHAGSVERGRAVYQAECAMCHHPDRHMEGPRHRGVLGRRAGALKDYPYSPALRNSRVLWTRATLKAWLEDPEALIPGQLMDVRLESAQDREDVVAYLATLREPARTPPR
ncbi:MAG: c-type cytochrome [Burkholderiaceae bacterium]